VTPEDGYQPIADPDAWPDQPESDVWVQFFGALDERRAAASPESLRRALDVALRSAALETGAIEGLYATSRGITQTVALQGAMWEEVLDEIGPEVRGHFEAQLEALEHVRALVAEDRPITEAALRDLHAVTCRTQTTYRVKTSVGWQEHPLRHGEYKTFANHVVTADGRWHYYCPPDDVPAEMARLVALIRSPEFAALSPVVQAAYAHHAFTAIHPFADGNGRVARALASAFLYGAAGIPLVVYSDQQERYRAALHDADNGDPQAFVRFIEDRALDTMGLVAARLREAEQPPQAEQESLQALFRAHDGLSYAEVEACGQRLTAELQRAMSDATAEVAVPDLRAFVEPKHGKFECSFGRPYHTLSQGGGFSFTFWCEEPVKLQSQVTPIVGVADDVSERFAFIVIDANRAQAEPLLLRTDDLHPAVTTSATLRLEAWVSEARRRAIRDLRAGVAAALRRQGFAPGEADT
jgi:Fic family protein